MTQRFNIKTSIVNRIKCAQEPVSPMFTYAFIIMHLLSYAKDINHIFVIYEQQESTRSSKLICLYVYMFSHFYLAEITRKKHCFCQVSQS